MKFMLATFLITASAAFGPGSVFAYTSSPAGNERVRDPSWTKITETRDPASAEEVKADKKQSDKKVEVPKTKN